MNSLNIKQKILIGIASILFISSGIYPNWIQEAKSSSRGTVQFNIDRHLIINPPDYDSTYYYSIDTTRLFIEWATIAIPTFFLVLVLKDSD